MMNEKCQPFRELLPCYAIEALEPDQVRSLEQHLHTCANCRAELEQYRAIGDGLLYAIPCQSPPPRVRAGLIARLAADRPQAAPRTGLRWQHVWQWAIGLALAVLLAFNVSTLAQFSTLQRHQSELEQDLYVSQKAISLVAYPDSRTFALSGQATGTLVVNDQLRSGALFVWGLAPLDEAHTYQVWLVQKDGTRVSGGLFKPDVGQQFASALVTWPQALADFVGLGVTVEPRGGSPGPTTPRVFGATF
jgi:anti-sigma-K factor RskA